MLRLPLFISSVVCLRCWVGCEGGTTQALSEPPSAEPLTLLCNSSSACLLEPLPCCNPAPQTVLPLGVCAPGATMLPWFQAGVGAIPLLGPMYLRCAGWLGTWDAARRARNCLAGT